MRVGSVMSALASAGRTFVITALLLVTLDAAVLTLRAWPSTSFPGWFSDKVAEKVADSVRERGEKLYGQDEWLERIILLESTIAFRMALALKLRLLLSASLLAALVALVLAFIRGRRGGREQGGPPKERDGTVRIPLGILVLVLLAGALPSGAIVGFVCYLVADWQRRSAVGARKRTFLLIAYQVACAFIIVVWDLVAQMPWGEGWTKMYPLLGKLLGVE